MLLNDIQLDVLKELINIGVGRAAGVLNQMARTHVELMVPEVEAVCLGMLSRHPLFEKGRKVSAVRLCFEGSFSGSASLVFPQSSASKLTSVLVGENADSFGMDLDTLRIGTLQEVGNIVLNGVTGSIANILGKHLDFFPPDYFEDELEALFDPETMDSTLLLIRTHFHMHDHEIAGDVLIVFKMGSFDTLVEAIDALPVFQSIQNQAR